MGFHDIAHITENDMYQLSAQGSVLKRGFQQLGRMFGRMFQEILYHRTRILWIPDLGTKKNEKKDTKNGHHKMVTKSAYHIIPGNQNVVLKS